MAEREGAVTNDKSGETPRQEQATSKETLADLESEEKGAASSTAGAASNDQGAAESSMPSPDGAFDSPRGGRADGGDTGGPM